MTPRKADLALENRSPKQGVTTDQSDSLDWNARALLAWHIAILRYALTLENADRLNVLSVAAEIDGPDRQSGNGSDFRFFRRTSSQLCAAILDPNDAPRTILRQYLARIDDARLRQVLAAALGIDRGEPAPDGRLRKSNPNLWKGLLSRNSIRT